MPAHVSRNALNRFCYMPVYTKADLKKVFKKELLSTLEGKSCLHIKTLDRTLEDQIRGALSIGYELYGKNGWVSRGETIAQ